MLGFIVYASDIYYLPTNYAALLKNFTFYAQIMLIDIEQFPDIYSFNLHVFVGK